MPPGRGKAGRIGGGRRGNKTVDLEDVSFASKGSAAEVHTRPTRELTHFFRLELRILLACVVCSCLFLFFFGYSRSPNI